MLLTNTNDIIDLIRANLKYKAFNIAKYFDWYSINEHTPIIIKLRVLDNCMYSSLLYGCELWWKVDHIKYELLKDERKILKMILGTKQGTSNDHVYIELSRPDIVSKIKDRQQKSYTKLHKLNEADAIVKKAMYYCDALPICDYYTQLSDQHLIK